MSLRRKRASGGIAGAALTLPQMAARVADAGTGGDNSRSGGMIAHINAHEAAMLKAAGGSGDINPRTGLRQFTEDAGVGDASNDVGGGGHGGPGGNTGSTDGGSGISQSPSANEPSFDDQQSGKYSNATPGPANAPGYDPDVDPNAPGFFNSIKGFFGQLHQPESATMGKAAAANPDTYNGIVSSPAAYAGAGLVGTMLGGLPGGALAKGGLAAANGEDLAGITNHALGTTVGGIVNGIASAAANGKGVGVSNDATNTAGGSSVTPTDGLASQAAINSAAQILAAPGQNTDAQRLQALYAMGGSLSPAQIGALQAPSASVAQPAVGIMGYASGGQIAHKFASGSGLFPGSAPGRADTITTQLPPGGHVVPADVVSGLGQGNTASGAAALKKMIASAPRSTTRMANGGATPVKVSSGEFYVHPSHVAALGGGNLDAGHAKLRDMSASVRQGAVRHAQTVAAPR